MSGRLTRRTWVALAILFLAIPALMAVFVCVWDERKYYLTSLLLVGLMFVPFVLRFEGRRPQARELVLLSTMTALAVAGRAAFYWLPQCKPVCAIVILTAVAFTPEAGFVTGAAAGLISNFSSVRDRGHRGRCSASGSWALSAACCFRGAGCALCRC